MAGRPQILSEHQKTIAFRAEPEMAEEMTKVAKEMGISSSELLRVGVPVLLKSIWNAYKTARDEAKKQLKEQKKLNFNKLDAVMELSNDDMERELNKVLFQKILEQREAKRNSKK